mgnify:CR=1 FL=1
MRDDSHGTIMVYKYLNNIFTVINPNIGSIDYTNGHVKINYMTTSSYDQYIAMYMTPKNSDVVIDKNKILIIDKTVNKLKGKKWVFDKKSYMELHAISCKILNLLKVIFLNNYGKITF